MTEPNLKAAVSHKTSAVESAAIYVLVEHIFPSRQLFDHALYRHLRKAPPGLKVHQRFDLESREGATIIWRTKSVAALREFIMTDPTLAPTLHHFSAVEANLSMPVITWAGSFFSGFYPGGLVTVMGNHFGDQPGRLMMVMVPSGFPFSIGNVPLENLQWADHSVSGNIPAGLSGVIDQPVLLQIVTADGHQSNRVEVQFKAAREARALPGTAFSARLFSQTGDDDFWGRGDGDPATINNTLSAYHTSLVASDSGTDYFICNLRHGWIYARYEWLDTGGIDGSPFGKGIEAYPEPLGQADFELKISWFYDLGGLAHYAIKIFAIGPRGVPFE